MLIDNTAAAYPRSIAANALLTVLQDVKLPLSDEEAAKRLARLCAAFMLEFEAQVAAADKP